MNKEKNKFYSVSVFDGNLPSYEAETVVGYYREFKNAVASAEHEVAEYELDDLEFHAKDLDGTGDGAVRVYETLENHIIISIYAIEFED